MENFFVKTSVFSSPYDLYGSYKNFVLPRNFLIFRTSEKKEFNYTKEEIT